MMMVTIHTGPGFQDPGCHSGPEGTTLEMVVDLQTSSWETMVEVHLQAMVVMADPTVVTVLAPISVVALVLLHTTTEVEVEVTVTVTMTNMDTTVRLAAKYSA